VIFWLVIIGAVVDVAFVLGSGSRTASTRESAVGGR
jgi:hypothetical protein